MRPATRRCPAILVLTVLGCQTPASEHDKHDKHAEHAEQAEHAEHAEQAEHAITDRACGPLNATCAADEYCAYTPGLCGKGKRPGTCRPKPSACPDAYSPVCGCDRQIHPSACEANAAGIDLAVNGGCSGKIPSFAACGPAFCDTRTHYCEIVLSDVFELPTDSTCKPLPPACLPKAGVAPPCDCFPAVTRCRSFCGHLENGGTAGFHLTCRL